MTVISTKKQIISVNILPFVWLGIIFLFAKLSFLLFSDPNALLIHPEELYRGAIAKEILTGLKFPLLDYQADLYGGGNVVVGLLTAPLFFLFGSSLFVLKLVPLCFNAIAFILWCVCIRKYESNLTLIFFFGFWIFAPPSFLIYSLSALGDHTESIFFSTIAMTGFLLSKEHQEVPPFYAFLCGLLSGFGLWFNYHFGLTLLALLLAYFLMHPFVMRGKNWIALCAGMIMGASPWYAVQWNNAGAGLMLRGAPIFHLFTWQRLWEGIINFKSSGFYQLLSSFDLNEIRKSHLYPLDSYFYWIIFFIPLLTLFVLRRRLQISRLFSFSLIYMGIFLLLIQASPFKETRYFIPAQPFIFYLTSVALATLARWSHIGKKICYTFFSVYLFGALCSTVLMMKMHAPGATLKTRGYEYSWLVDAPICNEPLHCLERYLNSGKRFEQEDENLFFGLIADRIIENSDAKTIESQWLSWREDKPELFKTYLTAALRNWMRYGYYTR